MECSDPLRRNRSFRSNKYQRRDLVLRFRGQRNGDPFFYTIRSAGFVVRLFFSSLSSTSSFRGDDDDVHVAVAVAVGVGVGNSVPQNRCRVR